MKSLSEDIKHLNAGKVLAYPTETVWGLGVLANNLQAIHDLSELKGRGKDKVFSILVRDKFDARKIVHIDEKIEKLLGIFWPGPITFVLPAQDKGLAKNLGHSHFIGLRCSDHPFVQYLVNHLEAPLVTTSANRSGDLAARNLSDLTWLPKDVRVCCKEVCGTGEPSLVVKIEGDQFFILRKSESRQQIFEIAARDLGFKLH